MALITVKSKPCPFCGKQRTFELDTDRVAEWRSGTYIQVAFPEMLPADRETLISGACPPCFAEAFGEE
ncbi:MAG TPA: hypothetical protein VJ140_13965 [Actinomycetota bacterium]|nr:hypothetical protein [Actinomycetota bacterium]